MSKKLTQAERDLARLNKSFLSYKAVSDRLLEGVKKDRQTASDRLSAEIKAVKAQGAKFERLRSKLPPVKFDMVNGRYFYSKDEKGGEVFAVKLSRIDSCVVYVSAKNKAAALRKAEADASNLLLMKRGETLVEDVSIGA